MTSGGWGVFKRGRCVAKADRIGGSAAQRRQTFISRLLLWVLVAGLAASPAAGQQNLFWDPNATAVGRGGSGAWDLTGPLWGASSDGVSGPYSAWNNGALDNAFFGGTAAGTVTLGVPITVHNITFETTGYALNGSTLTLAGVNPTISVTTGTATISSIINSTSGLTKAGAGTLNLTGSNSFNGGIDINGGVLGLSAANAFIGSINLTSGSLNIGAIGNAALGDIGNVINAQAGSSLIATGALNRTVNLTGTGNVGITGAGVGSAFFTGTGGLTVSGGVALNNDANNYTGRTVVITSGTVTFSSIGDLGVASALGAPTTAANGNIAFANPSQTSGDLNYVGDGDSSNRDWTINPGTGPFSPRPSLNNVGTGALTLTGNIALGGGSGNGPQFNAVTADLNLLGVISSNNGRPLILVGSAGNHITLGSANTYSGSTAIGGNVVVHVDTLADAGVVSSLGTGSATSVGSGATLSYTGSGGSSNRTWTINNGTLRNDGSGVLALSGALGVTNTVTLGGSFTGAPNTFSGIISGTGSLRSGGAGTWVIGGANTYTGDTIVDGGTLRAGNAQAFGVMNDLRVTGGTLDLDSIGMTFPTLSGTGGTVNLGSASLTLEAGTGVSASYAGNITGSGGLIKRGASSQTLTGANTYTGDTTLGGGTLSLDFRAAGAPASNIIAGASTLNMSGGTLTVLGANSAANTQTFDGLNITASNNVIDARSGTGGSMTLNLGAVTRTGGLIDFRLPANGNITTTNTALGGWATVNGTDYAKVVGGNITAFTAADYSDKDNAANWLNGEFISDAGGAANTPYAGTVTGSVQLGGLRYTAAAASTVTIGSGNTLGVDGTIIVAPSIGNTAQTITGGSLTGSVGGGPLAILQNGGASSNVIIASRIADNGGSVEFIKAGTGLVTLTNAGNSYTGATRVLQGILSVGAIADGGVASGIGASAADSSNLVLEGSTLRYTGTTTTTSDRGFTVARSGAILGSTIEVTGAAANLTFTGLVTSPDDANLTKSGAGTLTLANGANDYAGITTITGGRLSVSTLANGGLASGIGASSNASANLVLNGGGLQYTGVTVSSDRGFTLGASGGTIDVSDAATTLTLSGVAVGPGALTKQGAGTLVLSGTNTYSGGNVVNAGTLRAGSSQAFGLAAPMTLANSAGVLLDLNSLNNTVGPLIGGGASGGNVTLGSATLGLQGGNGTFAGTISGTGGILRTAGGNQAFSGCNNTYTGPTSIQGSTLSVDCLANGGTASGIGASNNAATNLVFNNAVLAYTGGTVTTDRGFQLAAGIGAVRVADAAATLTFSGTIIGGGSLRKDGAGTLVLSGNNTYTGGTQVTGGVLRAGSNTAFGSGGITLDNTAGVLLDLNGFDITVGSLGGGGVNGGNTALGGATLTLNFPGGGTPTYAGVISGSGGLTKSGGGGYVQQLTGCNSSYTGATTINSGVLAVSCLNDGGLNSSIGASTAAAGNLIINGTLRYIGAGGSTDRQFTLGTAGGTLDASGTGAIAFSSTASVIVAGTNTARTLTLTGTNTGNNSFAPQLADNGTGVTSLTKTGAGTWILRNPASTYTGVTTISGGVLGVDKLADGGQPSSLGASSNAAANLVIGNGSTLRYTGAGDTTDRRFTLAPGVTFIESAGTGPVVFSNTSPVTLQTNNQARTIALGGTNTGLNIMGGAIGDAGTGATTLAKNDSGTWALTGNNTYTGNTVINDGNLMIGIGGTTGNAGAGNVIVAAATSTLSFNRSDTFNFTGLLSGPGSIAQIGTGTTVLTAAGNAIGATRIDAGTLQVNGGLTTPTIAMNGTGTLTVNGTVQATGPTTATITGDGGVSTINVNGGGTLRANGDLGGGNDSVTLAGTLNTGASVLDLGTGNDTLTLNDGGVLSGAGVNGGAGSDTLRVNNAGPRTIDGLSVGGFEALDKQLGGVLTLTGDHSYSAGTTIGAGTLQIGNGGASGTLAGNILNNGTLAFNRTGTLTLDGAISGSGAVIQAGSGTSVLTATNNYTGVTEVRAGALLVNGNQSAANGLTTVNSGATLGGTGTIGGDVIVLNTGVLSPGGGGSAPGTLTINGGLRLNDLSILNYDFGQANVPGGPLNDLVTIGGDLRLDGTINVTTSPGGTFGPGVYRVFNYAGALTDSGLTVTDPNYRVQTSIANQVNLVNTGGLTLTYWDGDAGPKNNSAVNGGNGVWQNASGNNNWTDSGGMVNAGWADGSFAIFAATAGTVTVDNGPGQVSASGMQFATGGYVLQGGDLVLVGPQSTIRVGDGTAPGASYVATITANLTGSTQLVKTDLGTLVLGGANTYTGGTAINGGMLQVSSDVNLGDAAGALSLDGGTLRNTASFITARSVTLQAGGGTFQTDADLTASNAVGGTGTLTKTGTATLVLTGTNTYAGGTVINGGTVSVSSDANLGDAAGVLAFNGGTLQNTAAFATGRGVTLLAGGGTFETAADLAVGGAIGGAGALTKGGAATLTLTGSNTYTGGTTIAAGTLQLGDGGNAGSIVGNVANNGTLAFNRGDTVTFDGVISGSGVVNQLGGGTTILTGTNSYGGSTNVQAGSLIVNGDQSAASGLTTVNSGATLGGIGTIGGGVIVADGGALNPGNLGNAPGTLTINGNLSLGSGTALNYNFGQANVVGGPFNDHTKVGGDLVLDGTLNVTQSAGGNFNPGIYRVISYTGTLTNRTLELGALPAGSFLVQTSVAQQVNLVNQTGVQLSFWDGPPPAGLNDNAIRGGDGTWRLNDNDFWTNDTGAINAPFANATFAIFAGLPGTVTIDNVNGQVRASGLQFATDGYRIAGGPLELTGGRSIIRVGDGTIEGANYVATIDSVLTGSSTLVKSDLGTLVLTGNNTYTGGTVIEGGVIRVSRDANLGDPSGGVTFDGGTLQNTATFSSARAVTLNAGGGTFQTDADRTLSGPISGVGALTKSGSAALILTGNNTYTGGTTITAGTLQLGDGGTTGSIVGNVANNGTLAFNRSDNVTYNGVISGSGAIRHIGSGMTTLTGDSSGFAGTTSVAAGTLAVNGRLCGDVNVLAGGRVQGTGFICTTTNAGVVAPGNSIGTLTVVGNYTGTGGTIEIETVLGGDNSSTDRLVVTGNTAGTTTVRVINNGGTGAQTVEGIKVVDVGGASNGVFTLQSDYIFQGQPAIVAGAYSYTLQKNGVSTPTDGDWYLRSALTNPAPGTPSGPLYQPGAPLYEVYP